jgi:hypothetical protein
MSLPFDVTRRVNIVIVVPFVENMYHTDAPIVSFSIKENGIILDVRLVRKRRDSYVPQH